MARHPEDDQQDSANEISPPIVAETMREFLDKHYQSWIDTPLPALDGRTPRQAIKTKSGKDEVVVVLKYMENMEGHRALQQGECRYDFGWLCANWGWRRAATDLPFASISPENARPILAFGRINNEVRRLRVDVRPVEGSGH